VRVSGTTERIVTLKLTTVAETITVSGEIRWSILAGIGAFDVRLRGDGDAVGKPSGSAKMAGSSFACGVKVDIGNLII
jgi:hypothetical protein